METDRRTIGEQYEVEYLEASGAYGSVYCCTDRQLGSRVALKMLHSHLAEDDFQRELFLREARWLRETQDDLDCREIVQILNVGFHDEVPYFVMPFADRGSLQGLREGIKTAMIRHRVGLAVRVVKCLRAGMIALHGQGKLHRDIKPANILIKSDNTQTRSQDGALVGPTDRLLLGDLGLVKDLTSQSSVVPNVGTRDYMAPEVSEFADFEDDLIGPPSDIYSATVTVIFALTGDVAQGAWQQNLRSLQFGSGLINALEQGVAPHPANRFQRAEDWGAAMLRALDAAEKGRTILSRRRGDTAPQPLPVTPVDPGSRVGVGAFIVAVWRWLVRLLVLAMVGLTLFLLYSAGVISIDRSAFPRLSDDPTSTTTAPPVTTPQSPNPSTAPPAEPPTGEVQPTAERRLSAIRSDVEASLADTGISGVVTADNAIIVKLEGTVVGGAGLSRLIEERVRDIEGVDSVLVEIVVKPDREPLVGKNLREWIGELDPILFSDTDVDVSDGSEQAVQLDHVAEYLLGQESVVVEVGGHTDNVGRRSVNEVIGLQRANAAKAYLVGAGVDEDRIQTRSYGPSCPTASNQTTTGREKNRRVEIYIIGQDGPGLVPPIQISCN